MYNESGNITKASHGVSNVRIGDSNIGLVLSLFTIIQIIIIAFVLFFVYYTCKDMKTKMIDYESKVLTTVARLEI